MSESLETYLKSVIADVPDFPKPGILFRDITPLLQDPDALQRTIDGLADQLKADGIEFDAIAAVESRGFIFGTALGYKLGKGVILVRKPGKLPRKTEAQSYDLEYGSDTLEVHADACAAGQRVLIIDDLLATGGTAGATVALLGKIGAAVAGLAFIIELDFLGGRDKLPANVPVVSLVHY